jgi:hypothetical protein|tara:strand:- start:752 stop:1036 length:285 start_codon:yes stop_codon:yes gene_type:complete
VEEKMKLYEKQFSVAVYNTARLFGGHEEGGWWYTDREKVKDVYKPMNKITLDKYYNRIKKAVDTVSFKHNLSLEVHVFEGKKAPKDYSDQKHYE